MKIRIWTVSEGSYKGAAATAFPTHEEAQEAMRCDYESMLREIEDTSMCFIEDDYAEVYCESMDLEEVTVFCIEEHEIEVPVLTDKMQDSFRQLDETDFQLLRDLKDFYPQHRGILSGSETGIIRSQLRIRERDILSLRNLRNLTVMFYSREREGESHDEAMRRTDKMSAICAVIDEALFSLGAEI